MGSPFDDIPRLRGGAPADAGMPSGADIFNSIPRLRGQAPGAPPAPARPRRAPPPNAAASNPSVEAETSVFADMPRARPPAAGTSGSIASDAPMGPPAPPEEPAWYETLLDQGAAVVQGATQNYGDDLANFWEPGSGQIYEDAARRHPIAHGIGQAGVGIAAAMAAAPALGAATASNPLWGSMANRAGQALIQGGLSAASEYGDTWDKGKALAQGALGTVAGYGGAMFGEAAAGLGSAARGMFRGAPKGGSAALEAELQALSRAEPPPRMPRETMPAPAGAPPPLSPPPGRTIPAPAGPPPPPQMGPPGPPQTPQQSLRSTFANEFEATPPPSKPDLEGAFPDEFAPEPVDDAWVQELAQGDDFLAPRAPELNRAMLPPDNAPAPGPARGPDELSPVPEPRAQPAVDGPPYDPMAGNYPPASAAEAGVNIPGNPRYRHEGKFTAEYPGPLYAPRDPLPMSKNVRTKYGPDPFAEDIEPPFSLAPRAGAPEPDPMMASMQDALPVHEPMPDYVGDAPVMSPPGRPSWDPSAVEELPPPYAVGDLEPVGPAARMRGGPISQYASEPVPQPPMEPGMLWKGARALTHLGGRPGAALRAGMDALHPQLSQPLSPGTRQLGGALGEAAWEVGAPAAFDRKVNAQGDETVAYASPATTHYALTAVLGSGASGLSPEDEQTLTSAVVSGDDAKIRAADFRLRMSSPRYARAIERELRSYQDGEGY